MSSTKYLIRLGNELVTPPEYCRRKELNYARLNRRHRYTGLSWEEIFAECEEIGSDRRREVLILEFNGKQVTVKEYCKNLNIDYYLFIYYKASQPTKNYTEIAKEWFDLSHDEILDNVYLYFRWENMMSRCYNPKDQKYSRYGKRGINVYKKWHDYLGFKEDNWDEYINHVRKYGRNQTTIDRIDYDGNYEPSNCEWADWIQQGKNKSTTKYLLPCKITLRHHCAANGYNYYTIQKQIVRNHLSVDEALAKYLEKRKNK